MVSAMQIVQNEVVQDKSFAWCSGSGARPDGPQVVTMLFAVKKNMLRVIQLMRDAGHEASFFAERWVDGVPVAVIVTW
jgi:hypothetical protein